MRRQIRTERLKDSSYHALMEARRWRAVARKIDDEKSLCREKSAILAYAIELCLKSILMYSGTNITEINIGNGHDLLKLFTLLPQNIKNDMMRDVVFEPIEIRDFISEEVIHKYSTFEEIKKLVSNDFFEMRYVYEKYANGEPVLIIEGVLDLIYEYVVRVANDMLKTGGYL